MRIIWPVKLFELGQVVQEEMRFKIFLIYNSGGHFVRQSRIISRQFL